MGLVITSSEVEFIHCDQINTSIQQMRTQFTSVTFVGLYFCTNDINSSSYSRYIANTVPIANRLLFL